jgi:hypothetical protein
MKTWIITYAERHHYCREFVSFYTVTTPLTPLQWLRQNTGKAIVFAIETEELQ